MELRKLRDKATEAFAKGRFSKAAEFYEEYCRAEPKDFQARLRQGDAWVKAGQKDRAISAYQFAAEGFAKEGFLPRAIAASKLILELDPAHRGIQQKLADLYARKTAGGSGPQRVPGPSRRGELPTFTEHMGVSMGPGVAPLELPEEEEEEATPAARAIVPPPPAMKLPEFSRELPPELEIPVHEPLEASEATPAADAEPVEADDVVEGVEEAPRAPSDEELVVVRGVPVTPAPAASRGAQATPGQAAPVAPPPPQAAMRALVQAQLTAAAPGGSTQPAGRAPAQTQPPAPPAAAQAQSPATAQPQPPAPARSQPPAQAPAQAAPPAAPSRAQPPTSAQAQPSVPSAPAQAHPPLPAPAQAQPPAPPAPGAMAPPAAEPARPSASAAPPGLAPRAAQRPSSAAPAAPAEPPRQAPPAKPAVAAPAQAGEASASDETALELDLGPGTKKLAWSALSEPLFPAAAPTSPPPSEPSTPAAPPAPASAAPPGLRPRTPQGQAAAAPQVQAPSSSFTELELEPDDTLLHAVEEAAIAGMKQRAAAGEADAAEEEEEIILVDEVPPDSPSVDALPNIPLFSDLPKDAFIELFERCPLRRFTERQRVFEQGSHGDAFYVICEGNVRVFKYEGGERKEIATLGSGAFFGEMALLSGAPRMASVESASEDTQLLEISAPVLSELSRSFPQVAKALKKFCRERLLSNVMGTSALFQPFNRKDRRALVEKFRAREVKKNEVIVREGERADGLYVVLSGEVEARKGDQVLSRLKEGELFGEISLLSKTPATATVSAMRRTSLLRLPREDFDALILTHPQILVLISELSEQRLRRTEALTGQAVIELTAEELLV
jgi:CRP-like cAMP-binding protein